MRSDGPVPAPPVKRMGVFIDADNLNDATALDHVFAALQERNDRIVYKRAYGRTESLRAIEPVLWRHGVRPVANMVVNKVTTDSALVIDVVEAVCSGVIDAFALCSGDADFVPLATWAREKGCQVLCFSLSDRIFANPESFYDDVVLLEVVDTGAAQEEAAAAIAAASRNPALVARQAPSRSEIIEAGSAEVVEQVLAAFPALRSGQPQHLSQVVAVLRQRGILERTTKTTTWFARWPSVFRLTPQPVAHQVTYQQPVARAVATEAAPTLSAALPKPLQVALPAAPASAPAPLRTPALALGSFAASMAVLPPEAERILQAFPALRLGPQPLSQVVPVLRQQALLGRAAPSTPLFARHPDIFCLRPPGQPTHVVCLVAQDGQAPPMQPAAPVHCPCGTRQGAARALAWHVAAPRQPTVPMPPAMHSLRRVFEHLALQRLCSADVLLAAPELLLCQPCTVTAVAGRLRERGLLRSSQSALPVLQRHAAAFCLHTDSTPQTVCYRGSAPV